MKIYNRPIKMIGVRHLQVLFLFVSGIIAFGLNTCVSVAVVAMTDVSSNSNAETFDWDRKATYLILSSLIWGSVIAQIPFGLVIMRRSAQKVVTSCMLICGLTYLIIPLMASKIGWTGVLGCTAIAGFALASVELCQHSMLSRWAPPSERARLSSFVFSGGNLGNAFSMIFAGILAGSRYGWPSIFYTFGGIATFWAIFIHYFGANSPAEHPTISHEEKSYIESSLNLSDKKMENEHLQFPWKAVLKSMPVWAFLFCICGDLWNFHMMMTQLPTFTKKILNFDIEKSGGVSALPFLIKVLLAIPIGWLSDFALKRGIAVSVIRKASNTLGMWGPVIALVSLCLIDVNDQIAIIVTIVLAVGLTAGIISGYILNGLDLCPNYSGTLYSFVNTVGKIFGVLAPIVTGLIVSDQTNMNQWRIIFYISAAMYFIPNLIFIFFGRAEVQPWNEPGYSKKGNNVTLSKITTSFEN